MKRLRVVIMRKMKGCHRTVAASMDDSLKRWPLIKAV